MLSTDKDVREGAERKHINDPSPQGSNDPPGSRTKRQTCIIAIIIIVIIYIVKANYMLDTFKSFTYIIYLYPHDNSES